MRFDAPYAFLLLFLLPLLLEQPWKSRLLRRLKLEPRALKISGSVKFNTLPQSSRLRLRTPLLSILRCATFLLLILALARPQSGTGFIETEASGRDIMFVVDVSGSMEALDFEVAGERTTRLAALKSIVKEFIDGRKGDRIGLVVFGDEVFTQCPLTLDHRILKDFIDGLEVGMAGRGTAIGDAIAIGLKRIKDIEADSKVLVLVTDGMRTAGQLDPKAAAAIAAQIGVKIHTVGIGGTAAAPFRAKNLFGLDTLTYREVPLDEETLKEIAKTTKGSYFHAKETAELKAVYAQIDALEDRIEKSYEYIEYEEYFLPFALLGSFCFLIAEILGLTYFAVVP
jgi:Ca-activated chloride channel family protein